MSSHDKDLQAKAGTLSEGDISSERVSRRSLLGTLGIGVGVAAATVTGASSALAWHRGTDPVGRGSHCSRWGWTRTDPYDTGRWADPRRIRIRCTDGD